MKNEELMMIRFSLRVGDHREGFIEDGESLFCLSFARKPPSATVAFRHGQHVNFDLRDHRRGRRNQPS